MVHVISFWRINLLSRCFTVSKNQANFGKFFHFSKARLRVCIFDDFIIPSLKWTKKTSLPVNCVVFELNVVQRVYNDAWNWASSRFLIATNEFARISSFFWHFLLCPHQINRQFRLDANFENNVTSFSPFSVLKSIFVKFWHNSCNEFMSWSCEFSQVSYVDVK